MTTLSEGPRQRPHHGAHRVRAPLGVALLLAALGACSDSCCTTDPVGPTDEPVCAYTTTCEPGYEFRFGGCVLSGCLEDSECCPGTRCRADQNLCAPILLDAEYGCDTSADCPDPAQRCIATALGERAPIPTCVYELCVGDSDCGFGRACFEGRCVGSAPCAGSCPEGTACDAITGKCAQFPAGSDKDGNALSPGCEAACGPNQLKVFSDPSVMSGERCCALECACVTLPPIVPTRIGRYSRITFNGAMVLVSAYDAQFGDLVLARYKPDGSMARLDYIDGVPQGAPVVADPAGPRGGVAEPGPHVGTHTSIAADAAGLARIAYHDEDGRALKVAVEGADGSFTRMIVDGGDSEARVGQFTDIAVGTDGTIYVSYLAHNATLAGVEGRASGVKLARSRTPTPASASDWDLFVIDARAVVDAAAAGLPLESVDVPRARGLYTSIALDAGTPVIAYYDLADGDVRVALVGPSGAPTRAVLDGDGLQGRRGGDVGRFPTVARIGSNLVVVYEDFSRHEVRSWTGAATELGAGGTYALVDRGQVASQSGKRFVGAGSRLARGTASPLVVYQDASNNDLKAAAFDGSAWAERTVASAGAHGFYSDAVAAGGKLYIVSVEAQLDARGLEASRLGLTIENSP